MKTILVIDDDLLLRQALARLLRQKLGDVDLLLVEPAMLETFEKAALSIIQAQKIDLVLLDVELGGEIGFDIAKKIKEANPRLPIILMSGNDAALNFSGRFEKYQGFLAFIDERVAKPIDEGFPKTVKQFLERG